MRKRLWLLGFGLALLLAACGGQGGGGNSGGGGSNGGTAGTVNTPGGQVQVSLQGGTFIQAPSPVSVNASGYQTPYGGIRFTARLPQAGGTLTVTLTFPQDIPQGAVLLKCLTDRCNPIPGAQLQGRTATFGVQDGGPLDADGQANGQVQDPVALGVAQVVGSCSSTDEAQALPGAGVTWRTPLTYFWDVAYGNGVYVAVGDGGAIHASADGVNWRALPNATFGDLTSVAFGAGRFVAVGSEPDVRNDSWKPVILASTDGERWERAALPGSLGGRLNTVRYLNGGFIAVGSQGLSGLVLLSQDGLVWEVAAPFPIRWELNSVAYGNGGYVAVGFDGDLFTSPDGRNWTPVSLPLNYDLYDVTFANGLYVAVGDPDGSDDATILASRDGQNWAEVHRGSSMGGLDGVAYGNGRFVAVGLHKVLYSQDGQSWTEVPNRFGVLSQVTYANGRFLATSDYSRVLTSQDGVSWDVPPSPFVRGSYFENIYGVGYGGGCYVLLGSRGIYLSRDAERWTLVAEPSEALSDVAYGQGRFVAAGPHGAIYLSTDGVNWERVDSGTTADFIGVAYGNGRFLAYNYWEIRISQDGRTWELVSPPDAPGFWAAHYGNGLWVAVRDHRIFTSQDGVQWTLQVQGQPDEFLSGIAYGNGRHVVVGYLDPGDPYEPAPPVVYTSANGVQWSRRVLTEFSFPLTNVAYGNGRFVASGAYLLTSPDGENWELLMEGGEVDEPMIYGGGRFLRLLPRDVIAVSP